MSEECPAAQLILRVDKLEHRVGGLEANVTSLREEITVHLVQIVTAMERRIMSKLDKILEARGNSK